MSVLQLWSSFADPLALVQPQCAVFTLGCRSREHQRFFELWARHLECWTCNRSQLLQQSGELLQHLATAGLPSMAELFSSEEWCFPGVILSMFLLTYWNWGDRLELDVPTPLGALRMEHNEIGIRMIDSIPQHCDLAAYYMEMF
eukprot:TRINITY_DN58051_c0_g1_i1.p1 TRINITY_DN58051_c0_g1~~TRINITY_DN58051_c0_g1_i1.p1  ORF type:complete len:144 (+),score=26.39 TRINITY_DN58051_c0_g1_i1:87-518(+)